ncbi:MAG: hypothetical protein KGS61_02415 [Verrucomicrobia bacterium]|nr:hypothetical protein [Verrucomicrobiota bacterium]
MPAPPPRPDRILVCFALPEEAAPFRRQTRARRDVEVLLTGIGQANARSAIHPAIAPPPRFVFSCGFTGALRPGLTIGTVLFNADPGFPFTPALESAGAIPAQFLCADRIFSTAREKGAAWQSARADAVEMESGVVREVCRGHHIPSATVRVISDTADEDLPLDFNRLMTRSRRMNYLKLAGALFRSPGRIRSLLKLQRQCRAAAESLARVLLLVLPARE